MAPDPWLSAYDATYHLAQEIAEKLHERNRYLRNGENPVKINVTLRSLMKNLSGRIEQLKDSLLRAVSKRQITQLEGDRRQNLVDELITRERQFQMSFKSEGAEPDVVRSSLMAGGGGNSSRQNPWLIEEPEETRGLGFGEIRQQQQQIIAEQDAGLEALSSILARQKQMGQDIGNELEEQNVLLREIDDHLREAETDSFQTGEVTFSLSFVKPIIDDITQLVDNTDSKVRSQTRRVKLVERKSGSCAMMVVIVLLLIAIVVVAVWPTK